MILLSVAFLAAQGQLKGQSSTLLADIDFSTTGIGKVSEGEPKNMKYPVKGKTAAAITRAKRRLINTFLR